MEYIRLTRVMVTEFPFDQELYPEGTTVEQALQVELTCDDPGLQFSGSLEYDKVTGEIIEKQEES